MKIYFHIWNGHFKMWGYQSYANKTTGTHRIVFYWGKINPSLSKLQQREKTFERYWDAHDYLTQKIDEKLRKGYVAIDGVIYTDYSIGKLTLADFIKVIEKAKPKNRQLSDY